MRRSVRIKNFLHRLLLKLGGAHRSSFWAVGLLVSIFTIGEFLFKWGVLSFIAFWVKTVFIWAWEGISATPLLTALLIALFIFGLRLRKRLLVVAGEFKDDFTEGLYNWEFGGEGWKIEFDNGRLILSVSESHDGGITKKGFSWSDYEFSFDTKVIRDTSGWLIRATNRSNYVMIQLNLKDLNKPTLRLYYRYSDPTTPWVLFDEVDLGTEIRLLEWVAVRIAVRGSTVDVFINGEHALHMFLPDPIRFEKVKKVLKEDGKTETVKEGMVALSYPGGRVGFRCDAQEHAHFRNVRVKPL